MMSRLRVVIAGLSLSATFAQAQSVVAGQVTNQATGAPLNRVSVELLGARDTVLTSATSAADGTFTLETPGAGVYRVRLTPLDADAHISDSLVGASGEYVARAFAITLVPRSYLVAEVHRPVTPARDYRGPRYPTELRQDRISGCVLAEFIVDEKGRADTTSFKVLKVSHLAFAQAVRAALPEMRFIPAQIEKRDVRQRVVMPFDFSITSETRRTEGGRVLAQVRDIRELATASGGATPSTPPPPPKPAMCEPGRR